ATSMSGQRQSARISCDAVKQTVLLGFDKKLVGAAKLSIEFSGSINDSLAGLYRSSYLHEGKREYMLTTQFEAPDARRAFPCFDEPALKAVFKISLLIDKDKDAISNMPVMKTSMFGSKKLVEFMPTPRMSTYLVYIGVGSFDYVADKLGNVKVRAVTTRGKRALARLPVAYAKKFVGFYEKYLGIKYPLPKLDLIAVPDFAMGAMENWGAITFRELDMLCDEESPLATKQKVAITIAHELAHQWFGDLVTMKWWNDLWLNESFATFMSYKAVNAVFPEWEIDKTYVFDTIATALSADSLKSTHPISVTVNTPGEISSIFDRISYEKGGSVLNMLEDYVGKEAFRRGINLYLKKHALSNATASDLWDAISVSANNREFAEVAKAWITKEGYPVLHLSRQGAARADMRVSQRRFLISGTSQGVWPVPLHYITSEGKEHRLLLKKQSSILRVGSGCSWVKLNYRQNGLYRSSYSGELLESVFRAAGAGSLDDLDKWGLEEDLFALARSSMIGAEEYFDRVMSYLLRAGYPANISAIEHLNWIYLMLYSTDTLQKQRAKEALRDYCINIIRKLGFKPRAGEKPTDKALRNSAVMGLGNADGEEAASFASEELLRRRSKGSAGIDPDTRSVVYMLSAWNGTSETFRALMDMYEHAAQPDEKSELLFALGKFRDIGLIKKSFSLVLSKSVKLQDSFIIPASAASNPAAKQYVLDWTLSNWHRLMKLFPASTGMLGRFVGNFGSLSSESSLEKIKGFFSKKQNMRDDIEKELRMVLERVAANAKFVERNTGKS
ncbi:MAG: M1 family aminopeptidase, partial [Candidatus Micrarchaeaceae archaeon]